MKLAARERTDRLVKLLFRATGLVVIMILGGILLMLVWNTFSFFLKVKPLDFVTVTQWNPTSGNARYGPLSGCKNRRGTDG